MTAPAGDRLAVHYSSATAEHYTPAHIIAAAVATLGAIDLDPCSNSRTDPNVPAGTHYTAADDGLAQPWTGRVYMNPPYGRQIGAWVRKLTAEYDAGRVTEAVALVTARPDTRWWSVLRNHPVCFVRGRLRFGDAAGGAPFPSAVFYLGPNPDRFYYAFREIGDIYLRVDAPGPLEVNR